MHLIQRNSYEAVLQMQADIPSLNEVKLGGYRKCYSCPFSECVIGNALKSLIAAEIYSNHHWRCHLPHSHATTHPELLLTKSCICHIAVLCSSAYTPTFPPTLLPRSWIHLRSWLGSENPQMLLCSAPEHSLSLCTSHPTAAVLAHWAHHH